VKATNLEGGVNEKRNFPIGKVNEHIAMVTVLLLSVGVEPASAAGFPKPLPCRPGFITFPWAPRLCIDEFPQSATNFDMAMFECRRRLAYVASYGDLYYLQWDILLIMQRYNPNGKWIGPDLVGDNKALIGNGGHRGASKAPAVNLMFAVTGAHMMLSDLRPRFALGLARASSAVWEGTQNGEEDSQIWPPPQTTPGSMSMSTQGCEFFTEKM
jgi:hypothetical protein